MSGHSHWATIKRKKEATDIVKGKIFSKVSREIMLAVSEGGGITDPDSNIKLRSALQKAKEVNMPKENIKRVIDKITSKSTHLVEVVYEAFGPGGVCFLIKTATDNPLRTHTDVKIILDRNGGKIVEKGAVMYMFDLLGVLRVDGKTEEEVFELAEKLGALDMEKEEEEGSYYLYFKYDDMSVALNKAREVGLDRSPELTYRPNTYISLNKEDTEKVLALAELLDNLEEVAEVYVNLGKPE